MLINKKRNCQLVDFAVLADHKHENKRKWDFAREQKKLGNMKVKGIPIIVGGFRMVPKSPEKSLEKLEIREKELKPSRPQHC